MATTAITEFYKGVRVHIPDVPTPLLNYYLIESLRDFCRETLIYQAWASNINIAVNTRSYDLTPASGYDMVRAMAAQVKHTASNGTADAATAANPVVISSTDHGLVVGAKVYITGMDEMTELNDLTFSVSVIDDDDSFSIDIDGSAYTPETTGGTWNSVSAYTELSPKTEGVMDAEYQDWRTPGNGANHYFYCPDTKHLNISWSPAEAVPNGIKVLLALKPTTSATVVEDFIFDGWHEAIEAGAISRLLKIPGKDWTDIKSAGVYLAEFRNAKRDAMGDKFASNTHRAAGVQGNIGAYT